MARAYTGENGKAAHDAAGEQNGKQWEQIRGKYNQSAEQKCSLAANYLCASGLTLTSITPSIIMSRKLRSAERRRNFNCY